MEEKIEPKVKLENRVVLQETEKNIIVGSEEFKPNFEAFNKFQNFQNFESRKTSVTGNEAANHYDIYAGFNFGQRISTGKKIKSYP